MRLTQGLPALRWRSKNGGITYLRIADNGCGMSAEGCTCGLPPPRDQQAAYRGRFECYRHIGLSR